MRNFIHENTREWPNLWFWDGETIEKYREILRKRVNEIKETKAISEAENGVQYKKEMPLHPISGTADKDSPAEQILERKESAMVEFNKMDYLINTFIISCAVDSEGAFNNYDNALNWLKHIRNIDCLKDDSDEELEALAHKVVEGAAKWIADADAYWEAKEKEESPDAL